MKFRVSKFLALAFVSAFVAAAHAENADDANPFVITPSVFTSNGAPYLAVSFHVPEHHHIYADRVAFQLNDAALAVQLPAAAKIEDKFSKKQRDAFEKDFTAISRLEADRAGVVSLTVDFQGCSEEECYFPETRKWNIAANNSVARVDDAPTQNENAVAANGTLTKDFHVAARASGYLSTEKFTRFLNQSTGAAPESKDLFSNVGQFGMLATIGLILLGGLALNLTPCVLPMIPINLAILGAGTQNKNRRRGFLLGSTYGGGMALAYGGLGLIVVLTGSKFGTLNSSAWFNFSIAAIFVVLGLAMFDKLAIDLSRFQRAGGGSSSGGAFLGAGVMGAVSALLAGACVAPVVISVLLLATTMYQKGNFLGLLLPFVLGLGMAIPWPFAAAGLSFMPKPGAWMTRVKYAFGVFIFGFAAWYGWLGFNLSGLGRSGAMTIEAKSNGAQELHTALEQSRATGRAVLVDFWAGWCKNCEAMEHTTFRDAQLLQRLNKEFIVVKFQAEHLNDPTLKPVLDEFGVLGLPTYIVLHPNDRKVIGEQASVSTKN